jgi:hypothetical protein
VRARGCYGVPGNGTASPHRASLRCKAVEPASWRGGGSSRRLSGNTEEQLTLYAPPPSHLRPFDNRIGRALFVCTWANIQHGPDQWMWLWCHCVCLGAVILPARTTSQISTRLQADKHNWMRVSTTMTPASSGGTFIATLQLIYFVLMAFLVHGFAQQAGHGTTKPGNAAAAQQACTISLVYKHMQSIKANPDCRRGCAKGTGKCPVGWMPGRLDACNAKCGKVFEPFWCVNQSISNIIIFLHHGCEYHHLPSATSLVRDAPLSC